MARDGSGNYSLPSGNPVVTNTIISSSGWANPTLQDIASALTQSLSRDGQTTPTADLTMGNFKLRNLASAIARTDAVNAGQIQDGGLITLGSVAGTDTITASSAPAITAYTSGQQFRFIAAGANTTTNPTLNINGLGAKNITKRGANALAIGEIPNGAVMTVTYDGTQLQLQNIVSPGSLLNIQVITSTQTYTPTPGTASIVYELVGGGGAGGGAQATGASTASLGSGGGAGGYVRDRRTSGFSGVTVTIGAGGTPAAAANGGAGGNSTFGALSTASGGSGGFMIAATGTSTGTTGGGGGNAVGGTFNIPGQDGPSAALSTLSGVNFSGPGANSYFGAGGVGVIGSTNGTPAKNYGAGGAGAYNNINNASTRSGGAGSAGVCVIWEYA